MALIPDLSGSASVLVCGASQGIGLALCEQLLQREDVAQVFAVSRQATTSAELAALAERHGPRLVSLDCDAREVVEAGKRGGVVLCAAQTRDVQMPPDLWLMFAPIKKARTDFIVEKAAEMGARRIVPVQTAFTNAGRVQRVRLQAHAVEAAEQCGGTYVPEVAEMARLDRVLADLGERRVMFCDEGLAQAEETSDLPDLRGPWAVLIGPEGGFSDAERTKLHAMETAHAVRLGPRILRADTAAVAALTVWQQRFGDWT